MRNAWFLTVLILFLSCHTVKKMPFPGERKGITGSEFYKKAAAFKWAARDSLVIEEVLAGNIPAFFRKFIPVQLQHRDSVSGKIITAICYVAPDYLCLGSADDWARVNITPYAAQRIADSFHCFLPTRKIVDEIYNAARIKPAPVPLFAYRDSTPTMWQHHLIIEGQRKGRSGLIAGIKKDVVISGKLNKEGKPDRVAIYGWHKPDGTPIQPLYTGHIYWWVDYSQGIRLIYRKIKVDGAWMDYTTILNDPRLRPLLCDEPDCSYFRYPVQ